jgi:hypothetical protein
VIDYWWSTPIFSVFQLCHGIRHSDWLLVINTNLVSISVIPWNKTQWFIFLVINSNLVSISVIPWYKTQWLIIGDQLQSCQYFSYTMVYDTVIDYWWSTPILSVFQLYHGIRHSDWFLVINSNLVSISVMPWYKTQWLIIGDHLQSCQYFSYAMV